MDFDIKKSLSQHALADLAVGWLVGCFGFYGPLRQYLSLYRAREEE